MRIPFRFGLAACCISVFGTMSLASAAMLSDIEEIPQQTAIEYLYDQEIIRGYPDGTFKPEQAVSRAELLKILVAREGAHPSVEEYHDCFPDVRQEWFAPYVCYAKEQGWVHGYLDGWFRPMNTVNTVEAIKMMMTAMGFRPNQSLGEFSVAGIEPGAWYVPYVEAASKYGIFHATTIDTGKDMSRAGIADLVYQSLVQDTEESHTGETSSKSSRPLSSRRRGGGGSNRTGESEVYAPLITFTDLTKTYGDANFLLSALSNSLGDMSYSSSNTNVATVNGSMIAIVGVGTTTITLTQTANGRFVAGTATATLTVNGIAPAITFSDLVKSHIDDNFTLSITSDSPGTVTFTSGNSGLVAISGTTADILGAHGITTITASQAASGNYAAATKTMTITIYITYCVVEPCLSGGTCTPVFSGNIIADTENMVCECPDHYSGFFCDLSDINCYENGGDLLCNNGGTCEASSDNGTCNCINGFCGTYCQILPSQCDGE